ncbi:transporter substrate-binding domain-containing protein [Kitasatospora sp. NPDC058162]|uniref:caspase, EACC1-associated type n=1 Tax=Kitasatospora sp. NPDC058162 TaxID=3346362 RepID=UPI0036DB3721
MTGSHVTRPSPELPDEVRFALVVATATYTDPALRQLRAPARDADQLSEVLADPRIGGFAVTRVVDRTAQEIRLAAEEFLTGRDPEDLLLVYLSCHGLVDVRRKLYFAATDTVKTRLAATGVESQWLLDLMEDCRARRLVVILDCCFSGAFSHGLKGDEDLALGERMRGQGRGRVVLTASRGSEYSWEGESLSGVEPPGSVFTTAIVEGIRSGAADEDHDGYISVDDAYAFAFDRIRSGGSQQTPQRWLYGAEGKILLARSPAGVAVTPAPLPEALRSGLDSPHPAIRLGAVTTLGEWLTGADPARELAARRTLQEVADADIPLVASAARALLARVEAGPGRAPVEEAGPEEPVPGKAPVEEAGPEGPVPGKAPAEEAGPEGPAPGKALAEKPAPGLPAEEGRSEEPRSEESRSGPVARVMPRPPGLAARPPAKPVPAACPAPEAAVVPPRAPPALREPTSRPPPAIAAPRSGERARTVPPPPQTREVADLSSLAHELVPPPPSPPPPTDEEGPPDGVPPHRWIRLLPHGRRARVLLLGILLLAVVTVATVVLTTRSGTPPPTAGGAAPKSGVLAISTDPSLAKQVPAAVRSSGKLVVGTDPSYLPNEFKDGNGNLIGVDVDLAKAIAQRLGLNAELRDTSFTSILPGVESSEYQLGMSSITDTKSREVSVDMVGYFTAGTAVAVRGGNPDQIDPTNLCGAKVAVETGTTQGDEITKTINPGCVKVGRPAVRMGSFGTAKEVTNAVISGQDQAMLADSPVVDYERMQTNGQVVQLGDTSDPSHYGIAVAKGSTLTQAVQGAVQSLINDGTYNQILAKWGVQAGAVQGAQVNGATG